MIELILLGGIVALVGIFAAQPIVMLFGLLFAAMGIFAKPSRAR